MSLLMIYSFVLLSIQIAMIRLLKILLIKCFVIMTKGFMSACDVCFLPKGGPCRGSCGRRFGSDRTS